LTDEVKDEPAMRNEAHDCSFTMSHWARGLAKDVTRSHWVRGLAKDVAMSDWARELAKDVAMSDG
jgi:hypothetical protein